MLVDLFFDPAQRHFVPVQAHEHLAQRRVTAAQPQLLHLRRHFVPTVEVVVPRVAFVRTFEEHVHRTGTAQRDAHHLARRQFQTDQRPRPFEHVVLSRRIRLVDFADHEDARALARGRVDQFDRTQVRVHITLAVFRRLVVDQRPQRQGHRRVQHLAADADLRPDVEGAVGRHARRVERGHFQQAAHIVDSLADLAPGGHVLAQRDRHRSQRAAAPQVHTDQFGLDLVQVVVVVVVSYAFGRPFEEHVHFGRPHRVDQHRLDQLHPHRVGRSDPRIPAVHRQFGEHVEEAVDRPLLSASRAGRCRLNARLASRSQLQALPQYDLAHTRNIAYQLHEHDLGLEVPGGHIRLALNHRLHRPGQLDRNQLGYFAPQRDHHRTDQYRLKIFSFIRAGGRDNRRRVRERAVPDIHQHDIQVRTLVRRMHVLRGAVHAVRRRQRRIVRHDRTRKLHQQLTHRLWKYVDLHHRWRPGDVDGVGHDGNQVAVFVE